MRTARGVLAVDDLLAVLLDKERQRAAWYGPDLIGTAEVAEAFGVSLRTVERWAASGRLPAWRRCSGGWLRFRRDDVARLLAECGTAPH